MKSSFFSRLAVRLLRQARAQRVADLDRTQPNKLQRSIFDGERYCRQTMSKLVRGMYSRFGDL